MQYAMSGSNGKSGQPSEHAPEELLRGRLKQLLRRYVLTLQDDESKGILSFPPSLTHDVSHALVSGVKKKGLLTFVVSGQQQWDPADPYYERVRELAQKGVKIQRLFLLPQRVMLRDELVISQWRLDTEAGIDTTFLLVNSALALPSIEGVPTLDYGIWDDSLVCFVCHASRADPGQSPEWRVSTREADIEYARSTTAALLKHGELLPQPDQACSLLELEEPMIRTAPFARMLSEVVCRGSYLAGETCSWYHGVWQYLRILDLVSTPTWHKPFYSDALSRLKGREGQRVLISGTADYSTLAHVLWYGWDGNSGIDVTVLDLCETPLLLCRWYARQQGLTIGTVAQSILDYTDNAFDLIVTDAFLTRFDTDERRHVVRKWRQLLAPKGCIVTTVRLRKTRPSPSKQQVEDFRSRSLATAKRWRDFLDVSPSKLADMAKKYAAQMESFPITSLSALRKLFAQEGLRLTTSQQVTVDGEMEKTVYAEIVAVRADVA